MSDARKEFEERVVAVLTGHIAGFEALESIERLSGGASQETYRIVISRNGQRQNLAMRRAPGGGHSEPLPGHPGLATEALLMQSARAAGVPEPEVYHVLDRADELGDGFIMQWLDGEALGARIVRAEKFDAIRPGLARECGRILARIHGIDIKATGLDQNLAVIQPAEFIDQTWSRYQLLETPQAMIDYTARWLKKNLPPETKTTLVHNDFRNGNFMLTEQGINAVLDWEVAHIGDPMRDLGWICTNSWRFGGSGPVGGFGDYADLFAGYEEESGNKVDPDHVKFWEVFGSFWWAVGCLGMAEHYRSGPDKTVERPAIGRRSSECQVDCVNLLIPGAVELVEPAATSDADMPRIDELLISVRDFLRNDVMAATTGRNNFMARVASNSLDIVLRDATLGGQHRHNEIGRLQSLLVSEGSLLELRWQLVEAIRNETIELNNVALCEHLRATVVNQIAIDQPRYSGFATATNM